LIRSLKDSDYGGIDEQSPASRDPNTRSEDSDIVEVTFSGGDIVHYSAGQNIDVFFSESEIVQRYPGPQPLQPRLEDHLLRWTDVTTDYLSGLPK